MNLMNILTKALTSGSALAALSEKTGLSEKQLKLIIAIAIPLILRKMTSNASSKEGANSLLGALGQHDNKKSIDAQLEEADAEDGAKIIGHIFGDDQEEVIKSVAKEADVAPEDVSNVLGNISPSVLSGLSAATESASGQKAAGVDLSNGFDMTDVMGLLGGMSGGSASAESSGLGGLLSAFLGGASKPEEDQSINGNQLLGSLLSMMK